MPPTAKNLQRQLKAIQQHEQLVATWLVRLSLAIGLAAWAYEQWSTGGWNTQRTRGRKADKGGALDGKQVFVWVGAAMGVLRLLIRWHFGRKRKVIDEQLLEMDIDPRALAKGKKGKRRP
ncbi:hypothetical protein JCM8097_007801 [Rhodosporidiobolus ruineniae]